ncbi:MAG TPA: hypothetical protein VGI86_16715, partial [Acidimicrobiia bacterium]
MPEGSDSSGRGRPAPFDQDDRSDQGQHGGAGGRRHAGDYETGMPDEPDFAEFLAETQLEQQSAASRKAEADRAMRAALAGADEWYSVEADLTVEVRPPVVAIVPTRGGPGLERC